jgi:hypothetical protein
MEGFTMREIEQQIGELNNQTTRAKFSVSVIEI